MIDLKRQEELFKNHIATLADYGNIKVLDFKAPETTDYRIRFMFEEDKCKLHISGDLGELIATNYNNMTYDKFDCYIYNAGYFRSKIDCHSRKIYTYDEKKAREELLEQIEEDELEDNFKHAYEWESEEESMQDVIDEIFEDFSGINGISQNGYEVASRYIDDFWEIAEDLGKESAGIIELYLLAFKLAKEQVEKECKKMKFYELTEKEHLEMLMNGKKFNRNELRDLIDMYDFKTIEGEARRWQRTNQSFLKVAEKYFIIVWDEGLTEMQEHEYENQPYEVIKKEIKKVIPEHTETIIKWEKVQQ